MTLSTSLRIAGCSVAAVAYQVATNTFVWSVLLAAFGHWQAALLVQAAWWGLILIAVLTGVHRKSRLAGRESVDIFTSRKLLFIFGDEEQGLAPQFLMDAHPHWPEWLVAVVCAAWRNRVRNLPFIRWLAWCHVPRGTMTQHIWMVGNLTFTLRWRGWLTELLWDDAKARRFGKIGPRLEMPDSWHGVSWGFRAWARY